MANKTSSPFNFDQVKAHVQNRNAFDVGYSTLFTSPCGMILPVYVEEVLAGDYISLGCSNFVRTQPAVAPAFVNFDEKVDFYFVPYRLLWSLYDSWRVGTNLYNKSSMGNRFLNNEIVESSLVTPFSLKSDLTLPKVSYKSLLEYLYINDTLQSMYDTFGFSIQADITRMFDLLGYGCVGLYVQERAASGSITPSVYEGVRSEPAYLYMNQDVNIMRPLAYQCIIQHFYRNEDYEPLVPELYNVDGYQSSPSSDVSLPSSATFFANIFTPDFKCFRKDRFNSVKPINGFGFNALQILASDYDWIQNLWTSNLSEVLKQVNRYGQNSIGVVSGEPGSSYQDILRFGDPQVNNDYTIEGSSGSSANLSSITANSLRVLIANDAMLRAMVYSKKDLASLRKSELGLSSKNFDFPQYLGTHASSITLSDVVATATTSQIGSSGGSELGELAGKGVGGNSSFVFKREFSEDGIIIGMHYIMPRNNYNSDRLDRKNAVLSRYDMPFPQFDNLGLQPLWLWEYGLTNYYSGLSEYISGSSSPDFSYAFGFESRYGQYKSRVNEIHGIFQSGYSLDYWTLSTNVDTAFGGGKNSDTQKAKWQNGILGDSFFKVRPQITDQVFNVTYNGSPDTDPFMCSFAFDVKRVTNLSVMGVPSVNSNI